MNKPYWRRERFDKKTIFCFLRIFIKDKFPGFVVFFDDKKIYIKGQLQDNDWMSDYEFLIMSSLKEEPKTYILSPDVSPSRLIHMYPDKSLCLYYPKDVSINTNFCFVYDIIPWLIKWIHYYEIWLRNGNHWLGLEAPH